MDFSMPFHAVINFRQQAVVTSSAEASLILVWVESLHKKTGKDDPQCNFKWFGALLFKYQILLYFYRHIKQGI